SLSDELLLLAESREGHVLAVKHKTRPVYGVQFHPGRHTYVQTDGRVLLSNFFRIAGVDIERTVPLFLEALRSKSREGLDGLHETPEELRTVDHPVVCGVDMEDPAVIRKSMEQPAGPRWSDKLARFRTRMKELSGVPCMVVHYTQISREDFTNPNLRAIIVMGQAGQTVEPLSWETVAVIRETDKPMLGICRGHQLIGEAFGSTVARMRRLRPGEADPAPSYTPGFFKETGFMTVHVRRPDTLFDGLGDAPMVKQSHSAEVKQLPPDFVLLAGTANCAIESMKHRRRILYGVQFHPESYDDEHVDGRTLLGNFFRIAGLAARDGSD
ncbi:MAG TPA: hypothetical protein DD670_04535, partial [Planctomycetaceae bacterium]|nr:hypothetical protein [Planctomycetaceae bacterium]